MQNRGPVKMAGRQTREEGDCFPFALESPDTSSPEQTPAKPKRSLTPRGPLFPNLDEAHRNITSRLASNNPFRKPFGESQSSQGIALQDLSIPTSPDDIGNTGYPCAMRRHASDFVSPNPSRLMSGRSLTDRRGIAMPSGEVVSANIIPPESSRLRTGEDLQPASPKDQYPYTSGSTVDKILDQYAAPSSDCISSSLGSSGLTYAFDHKQQAYTFEPPFRKDGVAARPGFRGEDLRISSKPRKKAQKEASSPPQFRQTEKGTDKGADLEKPQAEVKRPRIELLSFASPSEMAMNSRLRGRFSMVAEPSQSRRASHVEDPENFVDSDWVTNEGTSAGADESLGTLRRNGHDLIPQPLRIPSNRGQEKPSKTGFDAYFSDTESSVGGDARSSVGSNGEPFRYDNEHYLRVRRLRKEKEVSRALRHLSHMETHTAGVFENLEPDPVGGTDAQDFASKTPVNLARPPMPRSRPEGSFFDPIAFRALHGDAEVDNHVRVVINQTLAGGHEDVKANNDTFGLTVPRDSLPTGSSPQGLATDPDWVTEATSEVGFGDVASHSRPLNPHIKATGSSLADYSDDGYAGHTGRFPGRLGSRDQILQHPSGESLSTGYELRSLKDTKQTVLLPRSHVQRVNGFAQNSIRLTPRIPNPANTYHGRQISNPFSRSYKRAEASSYFKYKTDRNAPSKYEFRDSTSEYTPAVNSDQAVCGTHGNLQSDTMASITTAELLDADADSFTGGDDGSHRDGEDLNDTLKRGHSRRPAQLTLPSQRDRFEPSTFDYDDKPTPMTPIAYGDGPASSGSKFKFPLLDLSEAQVVQKARRESGETDEAEDSAARYERAYSNSSYHPRMALPRPSAAYMRNDLYVRRGSHLSSTFTPPNWKNGRGGSDTPGQPTPATCIGAEMPTVPKRCWFGRKNSQPRLLPLDKRVRRHGSDRTLESVIQRDIEPVEAAEDHCVSNGTSSRRQLFFSVMASLSILPFFALLVLNGTFDSSLAWFTSGEAYRLTKHQRKLIKWELLFGTIVYGSCVAFIVTYFVVLNKKPS
ncbi:hypothetical protein BJ170DRAFT_596498 [Xylariales sp. AK1849]|nr:hypothetical protein BJ170DRAFT_596498 [Xylariales sp. AK1849]